MRSLAAIVASLFLMACGGGGGGSRAVTGSSLDVFIDDAGEHVVPYDFTQDVVDAYSEDGRERYPGQGHTDGTFTISGVPEGRFWLYAFGAYIDSDASSFDLATALRGRPDGALAGEGTTLALELGNLAAWQEDDYLELVCTNSGVETYVYADSLTPPLALGATEASGVYDYYGSSWDWLELVQASRGDRLEVLQYQDCGVAGPTACRRLARRVELEGVEMVDGQQTQVAGLLAACEPTSSAAPVWRRSEFAALAAQVHPETTVPFESLELLTLPGGLEHGFYYSGPSVLELESDGSAEDLQGGTFSLADPFPTSWARMMVATHHWFVDLQLPGAQGPLTRSVSVWMADGYAPGSAPREARPLIGPPRNPRVEGLDAFNPQTIDTTTPVVSWGSPSLGEAGLYEIELYRLYNDGGSTTDELIAVLYSDRDQVQVPAGLLSPGESYYFEISARLNRSATAPWRPSFPSAKAGLLTEVITVSAF